MRLCSLSHDGAPSRLVLPMRRVRATVCPSPGRMSVRQLVDEQIPFRNHRRVSPADKLVPRRGLEPPRPCERQHLKLVRLPIPPPGHRCSSMMVGRAMWRPAVALSTASSDLCQRIELQHIQARSMTGSEGGGKPAFAPFGWLQVSAGSRRASPLGSETPSSAVFSHSSPVWAMSASETIPVRRLSRLRIGSRRT